MKYIQYQYFPDTSGNPAQQELAEGGARRKPQCGGEHWKLWNDALQV